jgi:hypothetical protein
MKHRWHAMTFADVFLAVQPPVRKASRPKTVTH